MRLLQFALHATCYPVLRAYTTMSSAITVVFTVEDMKEFFHKSEEEWCIEEKRNTRVVARALDALNRKKRELPSSDRLKPFLTAFERAKSYELKVAALVHYKLEADAIVRQIAEGKWAAWPENKWYHARVMYTRARMDKTQRVCSRKMGEWPIYFKKGEQIRQAAKFAAAAKRKKAAAERWKASAERKKLMAAIRKASAERKKLMAAKFKEAAAAKRRKAAAIVRERNALILMKYNSRVRTVAAVAKRVRGHLRSLSC